MSELTWEAIEAETRRVVAENPDYVYQSADSGDYNCVYNGTDTLESCLFGRVFRNLGHPVPEYLEGSSVDSILKHFAVIRAAQQEWWAVAVQCRQDAGDTWSDALAAADLNRP